MKIINLVKILAVGLIFIGDISLLAEEAIEAEKTAEKDKVFGPVRGSARLGYRNFYRVNTTGDHEVTTSSGQIRLNAGSLILNKVNADIYVYCYKFQQSAQRHRDRLYCNEPGTNQLALNTSLYRGDLVSFGAYADFFPKVGLESGGEVAAHGDIAIYNGLSYGFDTKAGKITLRNHLALELDFWAKRPELEVGFKDSEQRQTYLADRETTVNPKTRQDPSDPTFRYDHIATIAFAPANYSKLNLSVNSRGIRQYSPKYVYDENQDEAKFDGYPGAWAYNSFYTVINYKLTDAVLLSNEFYQYRDEGFQKPVNARVRYDNRAYVAYYF